MRLLLGLLGVVSLAGCGMHMDTGQLPDVHEAELTAQNVYRELRAGVDLRGDAALAPALLQDGPARFAQLRRLIPRGEPRALYTVQRTVSLTSWSGGQVELEDYYAYPHTTLVVRTVLSRANGAPRWTLTRLDIEPDETSYDAGVAQRIASGGTADVATADPTDTDPTDDDQSR